MYIIIFNIKLHITQDVPGKLELIYILSVHLNANTVAVIYPIIFKLMDYHSLYIYNKGEGGELNKVAVLYKIKDHLKDVLLKVTLRTIHFTQNKVNKFSIIYTSFYSILNS